MTRERETQFERGARIVRKYIQVTGDGAKPVDADFEQGVSLLESCADELWEANWLLGKAYEAKGEFLLSAEKFGIAFQMEPGRTAVVHELLLALLRIDENNKARQIARHFASSGEPQLKFDLALVESTFQDQERVALCILDSFDWPREFIARVAALRAILVRRGGEATPSQ